MKRFWAVIAACALPAACAAGAAAAETPRVLVAHCEGAIGPGSSDWVVSAIRRANREGMQAVLLRLDTPGGLLESTRIVVREISASSVPVIVYVAPQGARAASAGAFITLSAHLAVMAPGTRIGAAHPVELGKESNPDMRAKLENDTAAFIKSVAESRKRNARWAEDAVRKSTSATDGEALALNVVDHVAAGVAQLLDWAHGRETVTAAGPVRLDLKGAEQIEHPMGFVTKLLRVLSDPNVAYILMLFGIYGILYEIINPGAVFPGVVGGICLILGLYALQTLPVSAAGAALLALAALLFVIESQVASGLVGLGGVIALLLGSLLLMDRDFPEFRISRSLIAGSVLATALFMGGAVWLLLKVRRRGASTGAESMVGRTAVARTDLAPEGQVFIAGEIWNAETVDGSALTAGQSVEVVEVRNLKLLVRPLSGREPGR